MTPPGRPRVQTQLGSEFKFHSDTRACGCLDCPLLRVTTAVSVSISSPPHRLHTRQGYPKSNRKDKPKRLKKRLVLIQQQNRDKNTDDRLSPKPKKRIRFEVVVAGNSLKIRGRVHYLLRFLPFSFSFLRTQFHFPTSGQAVVTCVVPSPSRFLPSMFSRAKGSAIPLRSSSFHRLLLTHALVLSANLFVHKRRSLRSFTSMHSNSRS